MAFFQPHNFLVIFYATVIAHAPLIYSNQYVGGLIGVFLDEMKERACHILKGSRAAEISGCNAGNEDLYRVAHEKLHMLAEHARSAARHLLNSADKKDEESRMSAYNIYQSTCHKLEKAVVHAINAADKMLSEDAEAARMKSHEVYKNAIEVLIEAAENSKIYVDTDLQHILYKYGPTKKASTETVISEATSTERSEVEDTKTWKENAEMDKTNMDFDNPLAKEDNTKQKDNKDEDGKWGNNKLVREIVEVFAQYITRMLDFATNIGKQYFGIVHDSTPSDPEISLSLDDAPKKLINGNKFGTSLQKVEQAFQEVTNDPKRALLKAKEAASKLEKERSNEMEYLSSKYEPASSKKKMATAIGNQQ